MEDAVGVEPVQTPGHCQRNMLPSALLSAAAWLSLLPAERRYILIGAAQNASCVEHLQHAMATSGWHLTSLVPPGTLLCSASSASPKKHTPFGSQQFGGL